MYAFRVSLSLFRRIPESPFSSSRKAFFRTYANGPREKPPPSLVHSSRRPSPHSSVSLLLSLLVLKRDSGFLSWGEIYHALSRTVAFPLRHSYLKAISLRQETVQDHRKLDAKFDTEPKDLRGLILSMNCVRFRIGTEI